MLSDSLNATSLQNICTNRNRKLQSKLNALINIELSLFGLATTDPEFADLPQEAVSICEANHEISIAYLIKDNFSKVTCYQVKV